MNKKPIIWITGAAMFVLIWIVLIIVGLAIKYPPIPLPSNSAVAKKVQTFQRDPELIKKFRPLCERAMPDALGRYMFYIMNIALEENQLSTLQTLPELEYAGGLKFKMTCSQERYWALAQQDVFLELLGDAIQGLPDKKNLDYEILWDDDYKACAHIVMSTKPTWGNISAEIDYYGHIYRNELHNQFSDPKWPKKAIRALFNKFNVDLAKAILVSEKIYSTELHGVLEAIIRSHVKMQVIDGLKQQSMVPVMELFSGFRYLGNNQYKAKVSPQEYMTHFAPDSKNWTEALKAFNLEEAVRNYLYYAEPKEIEALFVHMMNAGKMYEMEIEGKVTWDELPIKSVQYKLAEDYKHLSATHKKVPLWHKSGEITRYDRIEVVNADPKVFVKQIIYENFSTTEQYVAIHYHSKASVVEARKAHGEFRDFGVELESDEVYGKLVPRLSDGDEKERCISISKAGYNQHDVIMSLAREVQKQVAKEDTLRVMEAVNNLFKACKDY